MRLVSRGLLARTPGLSPGRHLDQGSVELNLGVASRRVLHVAVLHILDLDFRLLRELADRDILGPRQRPALRRASNGWDALAAIAASRASSTLASTWRGAFLSQAAH